MGSGDVRSNVLQNHRHLLEGAESLEGRDRERHLGLVVVVLVVRGLLRMQLLCEPFIGVGLYGEGGAHREHLEEERQPARKLRATLSTHVSRH